VPPQFLLPALDTLGHGDGAAVLLGEDVGGHGLCEAVHAAVRLEPVPDLLAEQTLGEGENEGHGPGQVEEVDGLVPHGQSSFTAAEGLGHLGGRPDGQLAPRNGLLVEDVCEASDLVLLVLQEGFEGHDVGAHDVARGEPAGVHGRGLGEDHAPAVAVALGQHEDVTQVYEF